MPRKAIAEKKITPNVKTEPATKAQPEPLEGAGASSTPAPSAPLKGPNCTSTDGKKHLWISKLGGPVAPYGGG